MAAMRVAIAGTNSLAITIAYRVQQNTNFQLVLLSRFEHPEITARGFSVLVVDYSDTATLQYALLGVDVVISTVTGDPQVNLIHAAVAAGVSRFAPAEFGATVNLATAADDPLDRGRALAISWLHHYKGTHGTEYCAFVCGILYERFDQGGLLRHSLGVQEEASGEGDYLVNVRNMTVEAPFRNDDDEEISVCLTAIPDVAAFMVEALSMREWPPELTMYSERLTIRQIVRRVEEIRGTTMQGRIEHDMESLAHEIQLAGMISNEPRRQRAILHLATAAGRFDFVDPTLNQQFRNVRRTRFRDWLAQQWVGT